MSKLTGYEKVQEQLETLLRTLSSYDSPKMKRKTESVARHIISHWLNSSTMLDIDFLYDKKGNQNRYGKYTHSTILRPSDKRLLFPKLPTERYSTDHNVVVFFNAENKTANAYHVRSNFFQNAAYLSVRNKISGIPEERNGPDGSLKVKNMEHNDVETFFDSAMLLHERRFHKKFSQIIQQYSTQYKKQIEVLYPQIKEILFARTALSLENARTQFENFINWPTMDFVSDMLKKTELKEDISVFDLYNHLLHYSENSREFDNRKGAFTVLQKIGFFYLNDKDLWTAIDRGDSIHDALAGKYSVSHTTVKHVLRQAELLKPYSKKAEIAQFIKNLDLLDPQFWPSTASDNPYYDLTVKYAGALHTTFNGAVKNYLKNMALEKDQKKIGAWHDYLKEKLKNEFTKNAKITARHAINNPKAALQTPVQAAESAISHREAAVRNVKDMKNDLVSRLILPYALNQCEKTGYRLVNIAPLEPLLTQISTAIWQDSPAPEQMESSSYWHSDRVNLTGRRMTASHASGEDEIMLVWKGIINSPITLNCGATLTPLNSHEHLVVEGKRMDHCVGRGSYTTACLKDGYHIFHIEDKNQKNSSTLTVQDYITKDSKRVIKALYHYAHDDTPPSAAARIAERELVESINNGTIKPDWDEVDASKKFFLAEAANIRIGYDFRDPAKFQSVFNVYKPCLPRKILNKNGHIAETFFDSLCDENKKPFHEIIREFMDDLITSKIAGIEPIEAELPEPQILPEPLFG